MTDEHHLRYEGWRVAAASGVGVFVGFASVFVYTFGIFLKPLAEEFAWSRESVSTAFGIAAMTVAVCSPAARVPPRPVPSAADHPPSNRGVRPGVRVAVAADAAPLAPLPRVLRHRHRRQRHRADGVLARRVQLVRPPARHGTVDCDGRRRGRRDGASADDRSPDRLDWMAVGVCGDRRRGAGRRTSDGRPVRPRAPGAGSPAASPASGAVRRCARGWHRACSGSSSSCCSSARSPRTER